MEVVINRLIKNSKCLLLSFIIVFVSVLPTVSYAQTTEEYLSNQLRLEPKIEFYADKYHVSAEAMSYIIDRESGYDKTEVGDTFITCKRTGRPIHARGLVQITDCYWPNVSNREALDDDFSLDFLAYWISKGKCKWWSTCPTPDRGLAMK